MKKVILLFLPLLLGAFQAKDTARDKALDSLATAERGFSAAAVQYGIKAAFLENLSDDAIVFLPQPVNGKEGYGKMPESPAKLEWYPAYADISSGLDWGYTTGPYELRLKPEDAEPAAAGFYLTVWKKQPNGQWKAAIDMGNSFPVAQLKQEPYKPARKSAQQKTKGTKTDLLAKDVQAVQPYANETLIYRQNMYPYRYSEAAIEPAANIAYTTLGHDIAPAADMAFTYGSYTRGTDETGYYLKVWKVLDGQWKLAAHNLVPDRKP
ncbi:YybH family protein [Pontibacter chitinilyticus]|uniref:YybH family protein n=1 Tax=Pontibacter chitinilyticus TaxID=2674989 RepID=UPI00321AB754